MIHNFNAGPSALPLVVKNQCKDAIDNFEGTGISILEFGHRTKQVEGMVEEAKNILLELMNLSAADYDVVFLQGGATTQFYQIPMNFLDENNIACFVDTGVWSSKAIKAAKEFGNVEILASSASENYNHIPKNFVISPYATYLHLTSNETIFGSQIHHFPESKIPIIVDMSSDILSRKLNFNQFDLIYAGAQKNLGIAGCTIVILKKTFRPQVNRKNIEMMQYQSHINNSSMFNTPPVFAIYVAYLMLRWLKNIGGIDCIEAINNQKAELLYNTIEKSTIFKPTIVKEDRSKMNVCFVAKDEKMELEFLEFAKKENIVGIKGHRSSGGFRASLYNSVELKSVEHLCNVVNEFSNQYI